MKNNTYLGKTYSQIILKVKAKSSAMWLQERMAEENESVY